MSIRYVNSKGVELDLSSQDLYLALKGTDFREKEWELASTNSTKVRFKPAKDKYIIVIGIHPSTRKEQLKARNHLIEVFDYDVRNGIPGRFYYGEHYLNAFVIANKYETVTRNSLVAEYTILPHSTPQRPACWIKDHKLEASKIGSTVLDTGFLKYPHGYPYTYSPLTAVNTVNNPSLSPSGFQMIIYGPVEQPCVTIGGHDYHVDCDVAPGELLIIDSTVPSIILRKNLGQEEDLFSKRDKPPYGDTFRKIQPGLSSVVYSGFRFDLTFYEERSEPEW